MEFKADLVFATEDPKQKWDLYTPTSLVDGKAKGVIVFVHGGAWKAGDKANHRVLAQNFIDATGLPVAVPNYRLSPANPALVSEDSVKHPTHASDIVLALMAIKSSSELAAIADTDNIYLVAHSCGCHMVASLMLDPPRGQGVPLNPSLSPDLLSSIKGIALVAGFYDLDAILQTHPDYREWVDAAIPQSPDGSLSQFSVDRYTVRQTGSPAPWLLIHSSADRAVDASQPSAMLAHLKREYERAGYDKDLIRGEISTIDLGDHIPLLNNPEFARVAATVM